MWTKLVAVALAALLAHDVAAAPQRGGPGGSARGSDFLRFACSQLVIERTDPIVNPGIAGSPHLHQIVGGDSFNVTVLNPGI